MKRRVRALQQRSMISRSLNDVGRILPTCEPHEQTREHTANHASAAQIMAVELASANA